MRTTEYEEELRLAVAEGVLSKDEADSLRSEALRVERSPLELLKERGRLSEETLASLRLEVAREPAGSGPQEPPTQKPGGSGSAPTPSSSAADEAFPVPGWDRYQPVRLLGQGGMGRVFLAYDPRLRRNVALKFMREGAAPELAQRFLSEARAQARVQHERVCEVYEVGKVQDHAYIAMQFVDGLPLGQLARELTLEQKVLVLRDAAEGVHAAHRAGLIHRDLKPSNILVERTEDGGLKPYVMDFGLARDWREEGTATGSVLGTPHYMAPEQARGEVARLDRRADVYALGATLYAILTGQLPFTGDNALEVLTRIQSEEPRPPRALDKDLPADLEAIVLKCLEKERSARYDSARALAEDLERFLSGEPVLARPAGLGYRLRKKVRKHRVLVSLGSAALLVVTLALGQAVLARSEVAERERLSRRFTESVERIEAMARYSAMLPLHDASADRAYLHQGLAALEAEVKQAGGSAAGPGDYALGRALLALGDEAAARERLESAWRGGFQEPRVAYALALVLGHRYQEQLLEVERIRGKEQREARRRELELRFREPALDWLHKAEGGEVPAPPLYVTALLAFYGGHYDEALAHLKDMGGAQPWLHEVPLLQGDILLARGSQRLNQSDKPGALADFEASRKAYAAAASIGESVPDVYYAQGRLEFAALLMELYAQGDIQAHYQQGVDTLGRALTIDPVHYKSHLLEARLHRRLAEQRTNQGGEVVPLLEKAIASARTAWSLSPSRVEARMELALALRQWARYRQEHGEDPREQLRQAIEAFEGIRPEDRDYAFLGDLGLTFKVWADYEDQTGADSLEHRGRAIEAYLAAIRLNDKQADAWINLGIAYLKRASNTRAPDTDGDLERAGEALEKALAINPNNFVPCFYGAQVHEQRAHRQRDRGGDYGPELEKALALYRKGLAINPKLPQLHNGLGGALLWQAQQVGDDGGEPSALFDAAQAAFEQARAVAPQQAFAYNNLGETGSWRALYLRERGQEPGPSARAAVEGYQKALELMPRQAQFQTNLARAWNILAAWAQEHGQEPKQELARATEALDKAMELNPRLGDAWRCRGETLGIRARWLARQGKARDEDFDAAVRAFQKAVELEPGRQEFRLASGLLLRDQARWKKQSGGDPVPLLQRSLALAEEALAARPRWPPAQALRDGLREALGGSLAR